MRELGALGPRRALRHPFNMLTVLKLEHRICYGEGFFSLAVRYRART